MTTLSSPGRSPASTLVAASPTLPLARERYEDAIAHGHTAALLEQERSSLFTQAIVLDAASEARILEIVFARHAVVVQ
jgi:hypothetical protein